ncbi:unnamed protein product [Rotaria magnacalcarata]|uniref:Uncharacterized protein n=1 Tax=Rotaria magnacalcarata TaxID=392030 RepID=A0A816QGF6_9BILA|nr:unnamed protein product [Rotaria magnacalcarata]CAF1669563.1 unnamed protein product [Rotaria magnacalcarata]CAF2060078.1 unnamed protein product [Rotaria magnacalcarata]CAF2077443.1 unnamed protein product [Rotaria magnacalcarata]CAF3847341.1 unnamed protein product [Rotaria magnacalcarata]
MSSNELDSFRTYAINVSLNQSIDQLHGQLCRLIGNTEMHFSKRKKLLLQLERKNNQYRRVIDRSDVQNNKKVMINNDLIRCIKKRIIHEDRQQRQQMRDEQNNNWSIGGMAALVDIALAGMITAATFIIMMLHVSKEKQFLIIYLYDIFY